MLFEAHKNLSPQQVEALIRASTHKAVRRVTDPLTGDVWYWCAEFGTHAEGAAQLGIAYDKRPGDGDVLTL